MVTLDRDPLLPEPLPPLPSFGDEPEETALERLMLRRRTCLRTIGVVALIGSLLCFSAAVRTLSVAPSWQGWLALADSPALLGLGVWCFVRRSLPIYAAAVFSVLWVVQGIVVWMAVPDLDPATAVREFPYSTYAGLVADLNRFAVLLGTLPAFVTFAIAAYAMFVDRQIAQQRLKLDRLATPHVS